MFNRRIWILIPVLALLAVSAATAAGIDWISKDELKDILDDPDTTVIDVRQGKDWESSDAKIKGAERENPSYVEEWAHKYAKDSLLVFY
jgi:hypothetical protein